MADISDVEQTLVNTITTILYPEGSSQASIVGSTCRVYRGWPNSATLNSDLSAGITNITVTSDNEWGKTTTRYLLEWQYQTVVPTLYASVAGQTISVSGTAAVGNLIGALVDGKTFVYRIAQGDTPELVAANLCTVIQATLSATVSGSVITIPGATSIAARVVSDNSASYEGRRQKKRARVAIWCSSPSVRDTISSTIDLSLSATAFLLLPDNSNGRLTYKNSATFDQSQNAMLYRRDLIYTVEYPTIITVDLPSMLFGASGINGQITFG
jgi:hypothetical protein